MERYTTQRQKVYTTMQTETKTNAQPNNYGIRISINDSVVKHYTRSFGKLGDVTHSTKSLTKQTLNEYDGEILP